MRDPIHVSPTILVPVEAMEVHAVRSGGPGGQNVNKVASKIELRVDLTLVRGLDAAQRSRLRALATGKLDADGKLLVTSQRTRDQHMNLDDARDKVRELVRACVVAPKRRRATRPTRGSKERRLSDKKHQSDRKRTRRPGDDD